MTPSNPTESGGLPRIVVVDAPGGPHPSLYLPSLLANFDVEVLSLDVEHGAPRERRAGALAAVPEAGGRLTVLGLPAELPAALSEVLRTGGAQGVVAFSERVVHAAQRVAWQAGLPANPPEVLDALQDKRAQRRLMRDAGLPVPRVRELHGMREVREAVRSAVFPAVLKPAVGMGSLATFRVEEAGDLPALWETARALAHGDARVGHLRPTMLLEEELVGDPRRARDGLGDYLSVEGLMVDGELRALAVSDKLPLSRPFRENGHILPALRPLEECEEAVAHVRRAHEALGIRFGATHTEVKLTADGPRVIEINGRVGGSVPEQLLLTAGYDLPLNLARTAVGLAPETTLVHHRWSGYLTPQPPQGRHTVERTPTAAELADLPGVSTVHHVVRPGQDVDSADGTASNLLRVVAVADTPEELLDLAARLSGPQTFALRPCDPRK